MGVRRHGVPAGGLPRGDPVEHHGVHVHVDGCGSLPRHPEAVALRDGADTNTVPVLDGVHLDLHVHAVLPASAGLQRAHL